MYRRVSLPGTGSSLEHTSGARYAQRWPCTRSGLTPCVVVQAERRAESAPTSHTRRPVFEVPLCFGPQALPRRSFSWSGVLLLVVTKKTSLLAKPTDVSAE